MLFDKELHGEFDDIVVGGCVFFGEFQWRLASLPIRFRGLGLYAAVEASSYPFVASMAQSWVPQDHILRDNEISGMDSDFDNVLDCVCGTTPDFDIRSCTCKDTVPPKTQHFFASSLVSKRVHDMEVKFDMTTRPKTILECLQTTQAHNFLLAIPINGLGQHMSPVVYRTIYP